MKGTFFRKVKILAHNYFGANHTIILVKNMESQFEKKNADEEGKNT